MVIIEKIRTNPKGLNALIGLLGLLIIWKSVSFLRTPYSLFSGPTSLFSGLSVLVLFPLTVALAGRKEWARVTTTVLAFCLCLVLCLLRLPIFFSALKDNPKTLHLEGLAPFLLSLLFLVYLSRPSIQRIFNGKSAEKAQPIKRIVYGTVIPALLVITLLGVVGRYFIRRELGIRELSSASFHSISAYSARQKMDAIGHELLHGKLQSQISKVILCVHPREVDGNTQKIGIVDALLEMPQMPQVELPGPAAQQIILDMATNARTFDILLTKEWQEKGKSTWNWYQMEKDYPDYKIWERFLFSKSKKGWEGSLFVFLKNKKVGRIFLRNSGKEQTLFYWIGLDEPVPDFKPHGGMIEMPEIIRLGVHEATVPAPEVLYPKLSAAEANKIAEKKFEEAYRMAIAFLRESSIVQKYLGAPLEIRPAAGQNSSSAFLDFSANLSFSIRGPFKNGYATVQVTDTDIEGKLSCDANFIDLGRKDVSSTK